MNILVLGVETLGGLDMPIYGVGSWDICSTDTRGTCSVQRKMRMNRLWGEVVRQWN